MTRRLTPPTALAATLMVALAGTLLPALALAHGSSGGRLLLALHGDTLHLKATPSSRLFKAFDSDGDGRISRAEVKGRRDAMVAHFLRALSLRDAQGRAGTLVFSDLNPLREHTHQHHHHQGLHDTRHAERQHSHGAGHGASGHVRLNLRLRFARPPAAIWLAYTAGRVAPLSLSARRAHSDRVLRARLDRDDVVMTILRSDPTRPRKPRKRP